MNLSSFFFFFSLSSWRVVVHSQLTPVLNLALLLLMPCRQLAVGFLNLADDPIIKCFNSLDFLCIYFIQSLFLVIHSIFVVVVNIVLMYARFMFSMYWILYPFVGSFKCTHFLAPCPLQVLLVSSEINVSINRDRNGNFQNDWS